MFKGVVFWNVRDPIQRDKHGTPKWVSLGQDRFKSNPDYALTESELMVLLVDLLENQYQTQYRQPKTVPTYPVGVPSLSRKQQFLTLFADLVEQLYGSPRDVRQFRRARELTTTSPEPEVKTTNEDFSDPGDVDWSLLVSELSWPWQEAFANEAEHAKRMTDAGFLRVAEPIIEAMEKRERFKDSHIFKSFVPSSRGRRVNELSTLLFAKDFPDIRSRLHSSSLLTTLLRAPILRKLLRLQCRYPAPSLHVGDRSFSPRRHMLYDFLTSRPNSRTEPCVLTSVELDEYHQQSQTLEQFAEVQSQILELEKTAAEQKAQLRDLSEQRESLVVLLEYMHSFDRDRAKQWVRVFDEMNSSGFFEVFRSLEKTTPEEIQETFQTVLTKFRRLVDETPSKIKSWSRSLRGELGSPSLNDAVTEMKIFLRRRQDALEELKDSANVLKDLAKQVLETEAERAQQEQLRREQERQEEERKRDEQLAQEQQAEAAREKERQGNILQRTVQATRDVSRAVGRAVSRFAESTKSRLESLVKYGEHTKGETEERQPVNEVFLTVPLPKVDTLQRSVEELLKKIEAAQQTLIKEDERLKKYADANIYIENQADQLFLDLLLETGFVFALQAKQVPSWLENQALNALRRSSSSKTSASDLVDVLTQATSDPKFWKTWLFDNMPDLTPAEYSFAEFKRAVLSKYKKT